MHRMLRQKLVEAGPGTIRDTEKALGLYRGYLRYHRHRQELDLGTLLAILKRLEISPADFFDEVAVELGEGLDVSEPEPEPDPEPNPEDAPPGAPPEDAPLTARAVMRRFGADLPVYGDFES